MTKAKLFTLTFLITTATATLALYVAFHYGRPDRGPSLTQVSREVFITQQLTPASIPFVRNYTIKSIVDIRPDGEESHQVPSFEIRNAAVSEGLAFHYIPVPHESIPDTAVDELQSVLKDTRGPTLLYCRTGRRAVRLFALSEASRANGPTVKQILDMVQSAGFSADDLRENLAKRIANRNQLVEGHH